MNPLLQALPSFLLALVGIGTLIVSSVVAGRATRERHFAFRQHLYEQRLKFLCDDFNRQAIVMKTCMDIALAVRAGRPNTNEVGIGFVEATKTYEEAEKEVQSHDGERMLFYSREMMQRFFTLQNSFTEFWNNASEAMKALHERRPGTVSPDGITRDFDALSTQARLELQVDKLIEDAQSMLVRA